MSAWLLLHLMLGAAGAWAMRRYALRRGLLDLPGERRSHATPTPRSGGVGIVASALVAGTWQLRDAGADAPMIAASMAGVGMVAIVGLVDDHRPLSPWLRLAVHAVAGAVLAAGAWAVWHAPWISVAAFALALVLTNVWNFMDGIDGIATLQAMVVAIAIAWFGNANWITWLAMALLAACAGFLPFNFPKARLFLGDVGSGALGFLVAALLVGVAASTHAAGWPTWLLLPSAFLIDASLTLGGRLLRREAWWQPHALHAYQAWSRRAGHVPVTLAYAGWTGLAMMLFAILNAMLSASAGIAVVTAWYIVGASIWMLLQGRGKSVREGRE